MDFIEESKVVDIEIGNGWFTWNNRSEWEYHLALILDRFLASKDILREEGEVSANIFPTVGLDH